MYTGIIKGKYPVVVVENKPGLKSFEIVLPQQVLEGIQHGASIAIDGVCLTVVAIGNERVRFDVMEETLRLTTLGNLRLGDLVNVERSARAGDEIGGHLMSGHISTMAEIVNMEVSDNNKAMTFKVDPTWMRFIFSKGFVGIDGASLTIVNAQKESGTFKVWFIPETLRLTRFGDKKIGDFVNVEIDSQTQTIVETVQEVMKSQNQNVISRSAGSCETLASSTIICLPKKRIAIVVGSFHAKACEQMLKAAREQATADGLEITEEVWVPGSIEKPLALKRLLTRDDIDGAVTLGIIERGETKHGLVMGHVVTDAIIKLQLEYMKPIGLGILGPEILPHQISSRLEGYARAAVSAVAKMI